MAVFSLVEHFRLPLLRGGGIYCTVQTLRRLPTFFVVSI